MRLRGAREAGLEGDRHLGVAADEVQDDQAEAARTALERYAESLGLLLD